MKRGEFSGNSVLYWMNRDKRVDDNWAMIGAQSLALKHHVPLIVCFQYVGNFPDSNIRQYGFLFRGLLELKAKLEKLNIEFVLSQGETQIDLMKIIEERSVGTIIVDHSPLKIYQKRINFMVNILFITGFGKIYYQQSVITRGLDFVLIENFGEIKIIILKVLKLKIL